MKHLRYEDTVNMGAGGYGTDARYEIDWHNGERKYKVPCQGVRIYENDLIEVRNAGFRRPEWRANVRRLLGLDFRLLSGLAGYTLYDPERGEKVAKAYLKHELFFLDKRFGRLYSAGTWDGEFTFMSEHAQPISRRSVHYVVPNKARYTARMEELKEYIALGETLVAVDSTRKSWMSWGDYESLLSGKSALSTDLTDLKTQAFCRYLACGLARAKAIVKKHTSDFFAAKYLELR